MSAQFNAISRQPGIDALRGLAILLMVFSGTIIRHPDLPAFLFHAQIPPPDFSFRPDLAGITWVDLVFPFFLFAMGMSMPFSLMAGTRRKLSGARLFRKLLIRAFRLWFFALMLGNLSFFSYGDETPLWLASLLSLLAFAGFFAAFLRLPDKPGWQGWLSAGGYMLLASVVLFRHYILEMPFSWHRHDIIILVLANMALIGGCIWLVSRSNGYLRLGILLVVVSLRLGQSVDGSWVQHLWQFSFIGFISEVLPGLKATFSALNISPGQTLFFHPEFLKYLIILIPGTLAGDWLIKHPAKKAIKQLLVMGSILLVSGLLLLPLEAGIKKDPSTYSYLILCAGLSLLAWLVLEHTANWFHAKPQRKKHSGGSWLQAAGQNPMLAYVVVNYLIIPLFSLVRLQQWMDQWHEAWMWAAVIRGIILSLLMWWITVFTVKRKWLWKT